MNADGRFRVKCNGTSVTIRKEPNSRKNNMSRDGKLITKPIYEYKLIKEEKISKIDEREHINVCDVK